MQHLVTLFVFLLFAAAAAQRFALADEPTSSPSKPARIPWTTSRVIGSPDPPPPYRIVRAFPNLKFEKPLLMVRVPGSNRLIIGEQAGALYSFENKPDATAELFFDVRKELTTMHLLPGARNVDALYGLA